MSSRYYASEQCFRRYESAITSALANYPNTVRFTSKTRSTSTDAARCTNALRSYKANTWKTLNPVFSEFEKRPLRCWFDSDYTYIGPAVDPNAEIQVIDTEAKQQALFIRNATLADVRTLVDLIDRDVMGVALEFPNAYRATIEEEVQGRLNVVTRQEADTIIVF